LIKKYNFKGVPMALVRKVAMDVLIGLEHLHGCGIIHTDLKPENVLVSCPLGVPVDKRGMPLLSKAPALPPEPKPKENPVESKAQIEGPAFARGELKPSRSDPSLLTSYGDVAQEIKLRTRTLYHHKQELPKPKGTEKDSVGFEKRQDGRSYPRQEDIDRIKASGVDLFAHPDAFFKGMRAGWTGISVT